MRLITKAEWKRARAEDIVLVGSGQVPLAPHFVRALRNGTLCRASLCGPSTDHLSKSGDQRRITTIDGALQRDVAGIASHQRTLLTKYGAANVAVVVLDNATGAIRAYEGSGGWTGALSMNQGGMIDGVREPRQTGSVIKAFVYALAFDEGASPGDLVDDAPFVAAGATGEFRPRNYDKRFRGELTLREALAQSVNVAAVRVLAEHGPADLVALLGRAGVTLPESTYGLSLALGAAEVDLMKLTAAYAMFARGGRSLQPVALEPARSQPGHRVISPEAAFLVTDVLADNDARTPAFGRSSALRFDFPVSAKTGTSSDFHDNWVIGSSARVTVGVWVGNFDRTPLRGATGVTGAGPVFRAVMLAAEDRLAEDGPVLPLLRPPSSLTRIAACRRAVCDASTDDYVRASPVALSSDSGRRHRPKTDGLAIVSPSGRGAYVIDPNRSVGQQLPLRASGGEAPYYYTVNGARQQKPWWEPTVGTHRVCVTDAATRRTCREFRVRFVG